MHCIRVTRIHINALVALGVLLVMFGSIIGLAYAALELTGGVVDRDLVALMAMAIGGVVYTVKTFAGAKEDGKKADENGDTEE